MLDVPVVFIIFRRAEQTKQVFDRIARAQPKQLFVIADGPRDEVEAEECREVRAIIDQVDWPCEVHREYADHNLGLRLRISSGLNWVFDQVESAIILEDDCLPDLSFFQYCATLLDHYRHDEQVMHISGDNFLPTKRYSFSADYYFTRYAHIWGWATWRRSWQQYDVNMTKWNDPEVRAEVLSQFADLRERKFWESTWDAVQRGEIHTWDYQWAFACMYRRGLGINPRVNLVSNIGFGNNATHTMGSSNPVADLPSTSVTLPLQHPPNRLRNEQADSDTIALFIRQPSLAKRLKTLLMRSGSTLVSRFLNRKRNS